jgi:hypothetical protein
MAKDRGNRPPRRGPKRRGTPTWLAALHEVRIEDKAAAREFRWLEEAPLADKRKIIAALGFAPGDPKIAESDLADVPQADRVLVPCDRCGTPLWFSAPNRRWAERTSRATGYPCLMACLPCFKAYHDEGS